MLRSAGGWASHVPRPFLSIPLSPLDCLSSLVSGQPQVRDDPASPRREVTYRYRCLQMSRLSQKHRD
jgi:hypothetical protein